MSRWLFCGVIGLLHAVELHGQRDCSPSSDQMVYVEALGPGGLGSVNYERILTRAMGVHIGARIGLGALRLMDFTRAINPDLTLPIGITFTKGDRWKPELGAGGALTSIVYPDVDGFRPLRRHEFHVWLSAGVRYAPILQGWTLRLAYTPIIEFGDWRHWGGLSVGRVL